MNIFLVFLSALSDVFGVLASGVAIYLFATKRSAITQTFKIIKNYAYQLTLSEIKEKIERLNEYNAKDPEQADMVVNILHEIIGQLKGNDKLKGKFFQLIEELEKVASDKRKLTEARKRAMVSELRERLRHLDVNNLDDIRRGGNE